LGKSTKSRELMNNTMKINDANLSKSMEFSHVIIGCGLSGSRVLSAFLDNIKQQNLQCDDIRIAIIDKSDNFGQGVPYGDKAERDFLLVEEIFPRCPEFAQWLSEDLTKITRYVAGNKENKHLLEWLHRYQDNINEENFEKVYFPRGFFGIFAKEIFEESLRIASNLGVRTEIIQQEAVSLNKQPNGYEVHLDDNRTLSTRYILLSVGSIPKPALETLEVNPAYLCDSADCGHLPLFKLEQQIKEIFKNKKSSVDVAVIGSSASAIETVYFLLTRELAAFHITIISRSGVLPRALGLPNSTNLPDHAVGRPVSDTYAELVSQGFEDGLINIYKAEVETIRATVNGFSMKFINANNSINGDFTADIVVDCRGSGSLGNTTSHLLSQLKETLPINDTWCGFELLDNKSVKGHPCLFVLGPLNNLRDSSTHVESIVGVFRESKKLADEWTKGIMVEQPRSPAQEKEYESVDL
jgi:uncharacterized NAD(P)/FAD-binding protein YdhS